MKVVENTSICYVVEVEVSYDDAKRLAEIADKCGKVMAIWAFRRMYPVGIGKAKEFIEGIMN